MINRPRRSREDSRQNTFFSLLLGGLLLIVVIFLVVSNLRINQRRADLTSKLDNLKKEITDLEKEKEDLQAKAAQGNDQSYLEQQARERFNLKKPGEDVITVIPPEQVQATTTKEASKPWWNIF